jgi:fucose 4-O-acetylase-like acetyltransferase
MDNRGQSGPQAQYRLDWVDVARGLGIVAVVVGHVWLRGPIRDAMYSFHMPLFFLLSGLLSRPHPVALFTRRQLIGQMRPYAAWLALLILIDQIVERARGHVPIFHQWPQDIWPILLGGYWLRGPFTIFWFVPCLMTARILFNMALSRWPDPLERRWALVMPPMLLLAYALGWWMRASPMGLLSVPMAFVLLWAGAAWPRIRWRNAMIAPLALLAVIGLAGVTPTLNMKAADYGWPLLSISAAIATCLLLFRLSALVARRAGPVAALGRASLVIMYAHVAVIHYLSPHISSRPVLLAVALVLPFLADRLIRATPLRRLLL